MFKRISISLLLPALLACTSACHKEKPQVPGPGGYSSASLPQGHTTMDTYLGEQYFKDEDETAIKIATAIAGTLRQQYNVGNAKRDAHPKAHGCVRAEFQVEPQLASSLAKGVFIPGKTYQAWIRFSNGAQDVSLADSKGDVRGMAIKLLGVSGPKLLANEAKANTQDFIMIDHPVFFANDPQRYLSFIERINSLSMIDKLAIPFVLGLRGSMIAYQTTSSKIANPLQARYWSAVPYQLGAGTDRQAIKFSAKPCSIYSDPMPDRPGRDYLRVAMSETLKNGDVCMEFLVQPRTSSGMSVEDSMTEWDESEAAFYKVASIRIPQQDFDTSQQNQLCENLSFSPWHSLPEHKPLGVVNRMRKLIYEHISQVRHEMNAVVSTEP